MDNSVIDMLIYKDVDGLCNNYGLLPFQVDILEKYYKFINSKILRDSMVKRINEGFYSTNEEINEMAKTYISKCILFSQDSGKSLLIDKCGLSEEDAQRFIDSYKKSDKDVKEMLSAELDVSNANIIMNDMLESVSVPFIESQKSKTL